MPQIVAGAQVKNKITGADCVDCCLPFLPPLSQEGLEKQLLLLKHFLFVARIIDSVKKNRHSQIIGNFAYSD